MTLCPQRGVIFGNPSYTVGIRFEKEVVLPPSAPFLIPTYACDHMNNPKATPLLNLKYPAPSELREYSVTNLLCRESQYTVIPCSNL